MLTPGSQSYITAKVVVYDALHRSYGKFFNPLFVQARYAANVAFAALNCTSNTQGCGSELPARAMDAIAAIADQTSIHVS